MSYLWEANHVNTFWIFVQGNYKSWKLGKIMKHTQILGHHIRHVEVKSRVSYTPTNLSVTFKSET